MGMTPTHSGSTKPPEPDFETLTAIQRTKPTPFSNGVLQRHNHNSIIAVAPSSPIAVTYKECLKNHAASLGGHALDGCGEFMLSPTTTSSHPTSLKCAACGCHRNFHRRESDLHHHRAIDYQPHHRHHPPPPPLPPPLPPPRSPSSASPPPISSRPPSAPHMVFPLSATPEISAPPPPGVVVLGSGNSHSNIIRTNNNVNDGSSSSGRKRFRTKFSQSQKERMYQFAEKVGWRMQKRHEDIVRGFCNEVGVDRTVFKVWMHNNKSTLGKSRDRDHFNSSNINGNNSDGNGNINLRSGFSEGRESTAQNQYQHHQQQQQQQEEEEDRVVTNGSSSSS